MHNTLNASVEVIPVKEKPRLWRVSWLVVLLPALLSSCVSLLPELPTVTLRAEPAFGVAPFEAQLQTRVALSEPAPDREWHIAWDLGDGTTAEGMQVKHTYTEPGRYRVAVTVTDGEDFATERSMTVQVVPRPEFEISRHGTGLKPLAVAAVDLNLDNHRDVISANSAGHNVSVFMGSDGKITQSRFAYQAIKAPSPAPQPQWMTAGDLNGDTLPDLLLMNPPDDNISLLFGNGLGGFDAPSGYKISKPRQAVIGEFTGDGNEDFIVLGDELGRSRLTLMMGRSTGEFHSGGAVLERAWVTDIAAGDIDRDGDLDVVVATQAFGVELIVLSNDGKGAFEPTELELESKPNALALADFDEDGALDIVTANEDGSVSILAGDGAGGFALRDTLKWPVRAPTRIVVADLNGDTYKDMVIQHNGESAPRIGLMVGNGAGAFSDSIEIDGLEGAQFPYVTDFNNDGLKDLVLAAPDHDEIVLVKNLTPR